MILIFKKDNPKIPSNYRPISVLSFFRKLYEKYLYSQLYSFLTKYNIVFKKQYWINNRKNHSKVHTRISLINLIEKHLDNNYFVCGIFIVLQKTFDTVNHDPLGKT